MVTTQGLAAYLRLPPDNTESLGMYLSGAQSKARSAGVPSFQNNAHYDLFLYSLAAMYYENRGMTFSNPSLEANAERLCNAFVLELRYAEEDEPTPEPDAEDDPGGGGADG